VKAGPGEHARAGFGMKEVRQSNIKLSRFAARIFLGGRLQNETACAPRGLREA